jgi:Mn2+/Fe2+ NRAMP family transporter
MLLLFCRFILSLGRYRTLDWLIKLVGAVLFITTLAAFFLTLKHGPVSPTLSFTQVLPTSATDIAFIIALMGWMPTALDLSAWNSLWTVARIKQTGYWPTLKETLFDFNFGYLVSAGLAICFLTMGAFLIHGGATSMPANGSAFANRVISMYSESIGSWSYLIVATAGFAIMFGTSIAVLDGYGRALSRVIELMFADRVSAKASLHRFTYPSILWLLIAGTLLIVIAYGSSIPALVDLATTISFLIAPLVAIANLRLVHAPYVNPEAQPPRWLLMLAYLGVLFLIAFSFYFLLS